LSLPPSSRRTTNADETLTPTARDKLDLQVAKQNVNLCQLHGSGWRPLPATEPGSPRCRSEGAGWVGARDSCAAPASGVGFSGRSISRVAWRSWRPLMRLPVNRCAGEGAGDAIHGLDAGAVLAVALVRWRQGMAVARRSAVAGNGLGRLPERWRSCRRVPGNRCRKRVLGANPSLKQRQGSREGSPAGGHLAQLVQHNLEARSSLGNIGVIRA
jgi:hypothetical protein